MKLPEYANATVDERKVTAYLLSLTHPVGRSKARYFIRYGFSADAWQLLADALKRHAAAYDVVEILPTLRGVSYTVEGELTTPSGLRPKVRVVWFQETGELSPHLVTAYPLKGTSK
ncbi:MAG TPA: hypothetical protein VFX24_08125 [Ktedonobacterales bacterium]|jgi:hypothetical protein|nr:hypothetical protein [Ktedonobacterales bacterium]